MTKGAFLGTYDPMNLIVKIDGKIVHGFGEGDEFLRVDTVDERSMRFKLMMGSSVVPKLTKASPYRVFKVSIEHDEDSFSYLINNVRHKVVFNWDFPTFQFVADVL